MTANDMYRSRRSLEKAPSRKQQDDTWSQVFKPPANESMEERAERIQRQQEAQRISREIDEGIQESRKLLERKKKAIKVLLLGQSESGKSTMLKNFQLAFSPNHFSNERRIWRAVVQLNLIGSVKKLLAVLDFELNDTSRVSRPPSSRSGPLSPSSTPLTDNHRRIRLRLLPLLSMETNLTRQLLPEHYDPARSPEIRVRAGSGWKVTLEKVISSGSPPRDNAINMRRPGTSDGRNKDDPTTVLAACREDIIALWEDPVVKDVLKKRGVRLEDTPGFFLNDTARIADSGYEPTEADIVRARLRTFGVEEHRFLMENGSEWYIYDVGGSRNMRPQWIPYFDDVQAIIFLAPLAFNQVLEEDNKVNRLEDSIYLWKEVCANPLLARANIILFLNKMDILEETLATGVRVETYVPSYGNSPNDVYHVTRYFREKFRAYHKRLSPKPRAFYCHETSAIDTTATKAVLIVVREGILRHHLEKLNVI